MYTSREGHARHGCPLSHCASQCPISPSFPSEMGNLGDSTTDLSRKKIAWVGLLLCLVFVFVLFFFFPANGTTQIVGQNPPKCDEGHFTPSRAKRNVPTASAR